MTGNSIQQALTNRSLTQFAPDPETGEMVLVPDLAVDLGQSNEDYTEWTFQLRDDATWETGDPVTAEEVAFGIIVGSEWEGYAVVGMIRVFGIGALLIVKGSAEIFAGWS